MDGLSKIACEKQCGNGGGEWMTVSFSEFDKISAYFIPPPFSFFGRGGTELRDWDCHGGTTGEELI